MGFFYAYIRSSSGIGGFQPSSTYSFSGYQPQATPFSSTGYGGTPSNNQMFSISSGARASPISTCTSQVKLLNWRLIIILELNNYNNQCFIYTGKESIIIREGILGC
jgi:hypothetical protein